MSDLYVEARKRLVDWLEGQLIGPAGEAADGGEYEIDVSPLDRYPVGVLHPLQSEERGIDPASEGEADEEEAPADGEPGALNEKAAPPRRRRYVPPSSVGFSFCVRGDVRLWLEAKAAVYEQREGEFRDERGRFVGRYVRRELESASVAFAGGDFQREEIWSDRDGKDCEGRPGVPPAARAGIDLRSRPHRLGKIVTVTLFNRQEWEWGAGGREASVNRVERSLFEARLQCFIDGGEVVDYPRVDPGLLTDEERELELQYRERRIFAVGHGAAVDWEINPGEPSRISSRFLPRVETPIVSVAARGAAGVLEMERLASDELPMEELRAFVGEYAAWVRDRLVDAAREKDEQDLAAALRITERMKAAHERMLRGVEMLGAEPDAALAFRLANRAMLRQMVQFRGEREAPWSWRPFQLGFLLATIGSTVEERDDHRGVLDLIWFQTGGGKTEAYLGLIAFLLVWRRLRYGDEGGGTAAFMRYTLRLLTRQQFERAARLICALELERREEAQAEGRLGDEPFSIGIWVGGTVCPNRVDEAKRFVARIRDGDDEARNSLLLAGCPWCGEPFDRQRGYEADWPDFRFHCGNPACEFGRSDEPLPCRVVDESLYRYPPSLLLATIDKFARFAWEERAASFFGVLDAQRETRRAPDLVIQDELHLISGPLGSVAGLYEAGIETAIRCRGVRPKYVASTATIRMAKEQVRALYGRDVAVFPPPGLSCDDSWFAKTDRRRPGRLYVGYLAPLRDQRHSLAPLAAALVAAPLVLFRGEQDREALFEAWWTSVVYHGSLRGVATSSNAFDSDVRDFGERLIAECLEERDGDAQEGDPAEGGLAERGEHLSVGRRPDGVSKDPIEQELGRRFRETAIEQLWSRHTAEQIAETFERLQEPRGSERCLDAVLATNMVSVGLDVARLALMVVNGQPLTTGEYVQATSRVGRGAAPGIVVANFYRHQARSLSHYESFRPYHESFYRFVEPGSVTPFTFQVRRRALHAALVIALRHSVEGLRPNKGAGSFDPRDPAVRRVVANLERRIGEACPEKVAKAAEHLSDLLSGWCAEAKRCREAATGLRFEARDKAYERLLRSHGDGGSLDGRPPWETLHSMRNVESPAVLRVR